MPSRIRFSKVRELLEDNGYTLVRIKGSHHVFTKRNSEPISIPVHGNEVKAGYVQRIKKTLGLK